MNKKVILSNFVAAALAGILIGLGGTTYLSLTSMGAPIIGALLFGFGLFTILEFQLKLYTGQIGYLPPHLPIIFIGNFVGAAATGLILSTTKLKTLIPIAEELCTKKLNDSLLSQLIMGFFCGILMFIAVETYKTSSNKLSQILSVFLSISIFILCGFEHCIANIFYFSFAHICSDAAALRILIVVVGNSFGSLFISLLKRKVLDNSL